MRKPNSRDEEFAYLDFPSRPNQLHDTSEQSLEKSKHPDSASSPRPATLRPSAATPGDLAFAQKCADLHRFIHPLLELLHGLKTGRFDRGLNSFQQSVAIDRLQRILGILQKPEMGERYLHNVLQIEVLLKMWFPQVAFKLIDSQNTSSSTEVLPHHWSENQLNIPVKKRKLSWSDPQQAGKVPSKQNPRPYGKHWRSHASTAAVDTVSSCRPASPKRQRTDTRETPDAARHAWTAQQQFTDRTGAPCRPSCLCSRKDDKVTLRSSCGSLATQDCSVSSSNTGTTSDSP